MAKKITKEDLEQAYQAGYDKAYDGDPAVTGYDPDFDAWYEEEYGDDE